MPEHSCRLVHGASKGRERPECAAGTVHLGWPLRCLPRASGDALLGHRRRRGHLRPHSERRAEQQLRRATHAPSATAPLCVAAAPSPATNRQQPPTAQARCTVVPSRPSSTWYMRPPLCPSALLRPARLHVRTSAAQNAHTSAHAHKRTGGYAGAAEQGPLACGRQHRDEPKLLRRRQGARLWLHASRLTHRSISLPMPHLSRPHPTAPTWRRRASASRSSARC